MSQAFDFFKTMMPTSRPADYFLGCLEGAVFMDFNLSADNRVYLCRISFDGYGCCNLDDRAESLGPEDTQSFLEEIQKEKLDQVAIGRLVKEAIRINQADIWSDATEEYGFLAGKN